MERNKPDKQLGHRLKVYRINELRMTQIQASMFFRVSLATIARIEAGEGCSPLIRIKIEEKLKPLAQAVA